MTVTFLPEQIKAMLEHAVAEYPGECVGAVTGIPGDAEGFEVQRLTNHQDNLHKSDPAHFDRDSRTGYFVDPKEVFELHRKTETAGKKIIALYHSHPDHDCYFSQEDHNAAVMWDEPVYPDTVYIVISVYQGVVKDAQVFSWDGKSYLPTLKLPVES